MARAFFFLLLLYATLCSAVIASGELMLALQEPAFSAPALPHDRPPRSTLVLPCRLCQKSGACKQGWWDCFEPGGAARCTDMLLLHFAVAAWLPPPLPSAIADLPTTAGMPVHHQLSRVHQELSEEHFNKQRA